MIGVLIIIGILAAWAAMQCWAISSLSATFTGSITWNAANSLTGSEYSQNTNSTNLRKAMTGGTSVANAVAGGGDELYSAVTSLAFGASASIDLTSLTDILQTSGVSLARVKWIMIRVLSTTDDSSIGTAATPLLIDNTVTNALSSQSSAGWFANAAEGAANGSRFHVPNGGILLFGTPSAAGLVVDGTHKIIKFTNSDGAVTMKVQLTVFGGST